MDTAIAIRTLVARDGQAHVQAGAGIVADSVPRKAEYEETLAKARALLRVLHMAGNGVS
jgi:anthranilate synthase component I